MRSERRTGLPSRRRAVALAATLAFGFAGVAWGHATIVFGTVTTEPAPPPAGTPIAVILELRDPTDTPVEDAVVHIEADPPGRGGTAAAGASAAASEGPSGDTITSEELTEVSPGTYRTELVFPEAGAWTLTLRDRTFRQEEARATLTLDVGPDARAEATSFIFPPTATGTRSLTTWLVWLIGLPLLAGAVVTIMVLRGGTGEDDDADEPAAPRGDRG